MTAAMDKKDTRELNGLAGLLQKAFTGYNKADRDANLPLEIGSENHGALIQDQDGVAASSENVDTLQFRKPLTSRGQQYDSYQAMANDPVLSTALDIHLAHALSSNSQTGLIFDLVSTDPSNDELVAELRRDLFPLIQSKIVSWTRLAAVYGVNYIRPYGEKGRGVVHIEHNYYTLPSHIREYERAGELAGYTSEHFQHEKEGYAVRLIDPWLLVPIKIPHWTPDINIEPVQTSGQKYSLFDGDLQARSPIETQNYGTSFLANSHGPWLDLMESLLSLRASRRNASRIDRMIGVNMDNLDPYAASDYMNLVSGQLKADSDDQNKRQTQRGLLATVRNSIIPILGNSGALNFDTQVGDVNIQHIEDVMFHLKRLAATIAIDPSLLGWSDMMAGGLGEGGWFRTAIQATIRADWLRRAAETTIDRTIDIHLAYKYGKSFVGSDRPYKIEFNSMNTAIEVEEGENRAMRVDYATSVMGLLDAFTQSPAGKSKVVGRHLFGDLLKMSKDDSESIINDLVKVVEQEQNMMESLGTTDRDVIRKELLSIIEEIEAQEEHN